MSAHVLATLAVCLSATRLQTTQGENIAFGKLAKQLTTYSGYLASRALNDVYSNTGSFAYNANPSWWEVDLRGYYDISNITLTAAGNGWEVYMRNAYVEVMDKDVSLCSDAQVEWCGNVSSTAAKKEKFIFTCNVTFPIRFIRSYYTPTMGRQVTKPSLTTSAITAGECGIFCHRSHSCIDFSYSKTAPAESNCLLTYEVVPQNSVAMNDWTMYTMDNCL